MCKCACACACEAFPRFIKNFLFHFRILTTTTTRLNFFLGYFGGVIWRAPQRWEPPHMYAEAGGLSEITLSLCFHLQKHDKLLWKLSDECVCVCVCEKDQTKHSHWEPTTCALTCALAVVCVCVCVCACVSACMRKAKPMCLSRCVAFFPLYGCLHSFGELFKCLLWQSHRNSQLGPIKGDSYPQRERQEN